MIDVTVVRGLDAAPAARILREEVFVREQGFLEEYDDIDATAWHAVLTVDGLPSATGRLFWDAVGGGWHIGRVAVAASARGRGLGAMVMEALERKALELGGDRAVLSAQCRAQGFYERIGYRAFGEVYLDEDCPHIDMEKRLAP